jgi:hypothetical protein
MVESSALECQTKGPDRTTSCAPIAAGMKLKTVPRCSRQAWITVSIVSTERLLPAFGAWTEGFHPSHRDTRIRWVSMTVRRRTGRSEFVAARFQIRF